MNSRDQEDGDVSEVYDEALGQIGGLLRGLRLSSDVDYTTPIEGIGRAIQQLQGDEAGPVAVPDIGLEEARRYIDSVSESTSDVAVTSGGVSITLKELLDSFRAALGSQAQSREEARAILAARKQVLELAREAEKRRLLGEIEKVTRPVEATIAEAESVVRIRGKGVASGTDVAGLSAAEKEALYVHYRRTFRPDLPDLSLGGLGGSDVDWAAAAPTVRRAVGVVFGVSPTFEIGDTEALLTKLLLVLMLGSYGHIRFSETPQDAWESRVSYDQLRARYARFFPAPQAAGRAKPRRKPWWRFW
jgi:hypothetical protein